MPLERFTALPEDDARFRGCTLASLSQASPLGGLPPPHDTLQDHAAHSTEWSGELRPNGSLGPCIPNGVTTFLPYTSRRTTKKEYARGDVHENRAECKPRHDILDLPRFW